MTGKVSTLFFTSKGLLYGIECDDGSSIKYAPYGLDKRYLGIGTEVEFSGTPIIDGRFHEYSDVKITKVINYIKPKESKYYCYNCGSSFNSIRRCLHHASHNCQFRGYDHI